MNRTNPRVGTGALRTPGAGGDPLGQGTQASLLWESVYFWVLLCPVPVSVFVAGVARQVPPRCTHLCYDPSPQDPSSSPSDLSGAVGAQHQLTPYLLAASHHAAAEVAAGFGVDHGGHVLLALQVSEVELSPLGLLPVEPKCLSPSTQRGWAGSSAHESHSPRTGAGLFLRLSGMRGPDMPPPRPCSFQS